MKYLRLIPGFLLLSLWQAAAQVSVEVKLPQEQYLAGEDMPITVRVINRSGQTLTLGDDPEWLTFTIEANDDFVVGKNSEVPVAGEFTLESSHVAIKHVDVAPYFVLSRPGRYNVVAAVRLKQWDTQVTSKPANFDIIDGAKLWSAQIGVPLPAGVSNAAPEIRVYSLEEANYLRTQLRLYLRITDDSGSRIFKVVSLGPMVSFGQPEPQLDRASNLHVLYQTGAKTFSYTVFNPDGAVIERQSYEYTDARPRLKADATGNISVTGGARIASSTDAPAATTPATANAQ